MTVLVGSDDGRLVQTIRKTVSRDGKTLTRRLNLKLPDGEQNWTEVYEKPVALGRITSAVAAANAARFSSALL